MKKILKPRTLYPLFISSELFKSNADRKRLLDIITPVNTLPIFVGKILDLQTFHFYLN